MDDLKDQITEVLVRHQRKNSRECLCGWGHLGRSHAAHVADAVLTVVTPKLERLRADRIVSCVFAVRSGECPLPFALYRRSDVTGVSGEGTVAYGVQFADGTVVIRWLGDYASTVVWDDLDRPEDPAHRTLGQPPHPRRMDHPRAGDQRRRPHPHLRRAAARRSR